MCVLQHFAMLNDHDRAHKYDRAIRNAIARVKSRDKGREVGGRPNRHH